jgi:hypothetical protein
VSISGEQKVGSRLRVTLKAGDRQSQTFKPTVTQFEASRAFEWLGRLGIRGMFDGRHHFSLTPTDRGTHLEQSETFTGLLTGLILRMVGEDTENGFRAMNEALKERVEAAS